MELFKRFSLFIVSFLLTLAIAEWITRQYYDADPASFEERFWAYNETLGWNNKANFSDLFQSNRKGYAGQVTFEALGIRSNGAKRLENPDLKILIVGDSTTVGMEVNDDKTYPALLEQKLRAKGIRANVYNAGVRGFGTDQAYRQILRLKPILEPDVTLYLSCGNDFSDNTIVKNWYRSYSKPTYLVHGDRLTLTNFPPAKLGQGEYAMVKYTEGKTSIERGAITSTKFARFMRKRFALYCLAETFYNVHFSSTVFNVKIRNPKMEHKLLKLLTKKMHQESKLFFITSFTKELGGDGIGYDEVQKIAKENDIPFLHTRPHFKKGPKYDFPKDSHWNETGHAQEADALYTELLLHPVFQKRVKRIGGGDLG